MCNYEKKLNSVITTQIKLEDIDFGSWGPIVETFDSDYSNVNMMEFRDFEVGIYSGIASLRKR